MIPRDTSAEAAALQRSIHRRRTPEQRLLAALELSDFARELQIAGLRARNPGWTDADARRERTRRLIAKVRRAAP
jgi:hypothetical protein